MWGSKWIVAVSSLAALEPTPGPHGDHCGTCTACCTLFPIDQPAVEVLRIEMLNGNREFCQEFLTDLRVPDSDRMGEVDGGWTVCARWMFHERMLYNSPYVTFPANTVRGGDGAAIRHRTPCPVSACSTEETAAASFACRA
mgnify:CR=1 FL=1